MPFRLRSLAFPLGATTVVLACSTSPDGPNDGQSSSGGSQASGGTLLGSGGSAAVASGGVSAHSSGGSRSGGASTGGRAAGGTSPSAGGSDGGNSSTGGVTSAGGSSASGGNDSGRLGDGFYRMERLNRGLVAVQTGGGNYISFRQMGYEYFTGEPERVSYRLLRDGQQLVELDTSTNYLDESGTSTSSYSVVPVVDGKEGQESEAVTPWEENYLRIPIDPPSNAHSANDASAADLDGDGEWDLVLKWDPNNAQDNSNSGHTGDVYLDGLKLDGTRLWRINLGPNIRAGAHYTQFIVADFDGDGGAEMAVKTAPGTRDGTGEYLSDGPASSANHAADYRNSGGYILEGPEYLTVFDGLDGSELATVEFDVARGSVISWGDDYGNRVDRFLATAIYLDDTGLVSFIMARGYYTRSTLTAWNFRDGSISQLWKFDGDVEPGGPWNGQGAHSLSVANVDDDLGQEVIYGAMTVDDDGSGKCSTGLNHGDALHASDFVPSRPGIEVFLPHEYEDRPLWSLRDGATCEIIQQGSVSDADVGRGVAADIDPANPGAEMWASNNVPITSAVTGQSVGTNNLPINFVIWWDGDESRELEDGTSITKYGGGELQSCGACSSNNGTKSTPTLSADLLGDWREEIIWRESNNQALRLYTTTHLTDRRIYTLMHDPQYRVAISWQNVAYNQPPHPSFHIGSGMPEPPNPNIFVE